MTSTPTPMQLPDDKRSARAVIRAARRARSVEADDRQAAAHGLRDTLLAHLRHRRPGTIAAYESLPTEPPSTEVIAGLRGAGWRVLVPDLLADLDLSWHDVADPGSDLGPTAVALADVLLIPALAVDLDGFRLGQGGGSYDRALLRRRPDAPVIAALFDSEIVQRVPREPHDQRVDAVLTAQRLYARDAGTGRIRL